MTALPAEVAGLLSMSRESRPRLPWTQRATANARMSANPLLGSSEKPQKITEAWAFSYSCEVLTFRREFFRLRASAVTIDAAPIFLPFVDLLSTPVASALRARNTKSLASCRSRIPENRLYLDFLTSKTHPVRPAFAIERLGGRFLPHRPFQLSYVRNERSSA